MPSPPTVDIAELLAPIPGENPAGQSVRYDGTYDALREARRADDPHMSQVEWVNSNLPVSIRAVPMVQTRDGQNYSWWHWEESRVVDNLGRQNQEAMAA